MSQDAPPQSARDVTREARKMLESRGWFMWFDPDKCRTYALRDGVFLAFIARMSEFKVFSEQRYFLESIAAESGFGFVITEKTMPRFAQWLDAFDRSVQAASRREKMTDADGALMLDCLKDLTAPIVG